MPTDINKALANAKAALGNARAFTRSVGDTEPSKVSPKPAAPASAPAPKKPSSTMQEANDTGTGIKNRMENENAVIGSMKKGGTIPKTGNYKMHAGEDVVKSDKSNLNEVLQRATDGLGAAADKVKSKLHMRIEPTDDKKFIVDHEYRGGSEDMKTMPRNARHAPGNLDELVEHIKKHYTPEMPEKEESKESGLPND